ncbi:MAG: hypothetical protein QM767_06195 [Anaeromyxobacter sp.]
MQLGQFLPAGTDAEDVAMPGARNVWDFYPDLGLADGGDDQFDGALQLAVGTLPTQPPTFDSLEAERVELEWYGDVDFTYDELTFGQPLMGSGDGLVPVALTNADWAVSGDVTAFLSPSAATVVRTTIDLTDAVAPISLSAFRAYELPDVDSGTLPYGAYFVVTLRNASNHELLETLEDAGPGDSADEVATVDVSAYAGQRIELQVEYRGWWGAYLDDVHCVDDNAAEYVTNGDFEAGTTQGWNASMTAKTPYAFYAAARTAAGLEIRASSTPSPSWTGAASPTPSTTPPRQTSRWTRSTSRTSAPTTTA